MTRLADWRQRRFLSNGNDRSDEPVQNYITPSTLARADRHQAFQAKQMFTNVQMHARCLLRSPCQRYRRTKRFICARVQSPCMPEIPSNLTPRTVLKYEAKAPALNKLHAFQARPGLSVERQAYLRRQTGSKLRGD